MSILTSARGIAVLGALLAACATRPITREDGESPDALSSWEKARADPTCVVPLCDEERCTLWRCQDVVEVDSPAVVLALSTQGFRPPLGNPNRWWGHPLAAPTHVEPVFEIPWHNWRTRAQLEHWKHPLRKSGGSRSSSCHGSA